MKRKAFSFSLFLVSLISSVSFFPLRVLAQWCNNDPESGVDTGFGCIPTNDLPALTTIVLRWAAGLSLVAALIAISFAGFLILTSAGDPKRVKAGQELLASAIGGVILIVLSVVILNFIGVQILNLGGLGFS